MEYSELTDDEQVQILQQRIRQYEGEHFNHSVNKELLLASVPAGSEPDDATKEAIKAAEEAMKTLDDAHTNTKAKVEALKAPKAQKGSK